MKQVFSAFLLGFFALSAAPCLSQKVCIDENMSLPMPATIVTRVPAWAVVGVTAPPSGLKNITGLELRLAASKAALSVKVAIYAATASGAPGALMSSGTAIVSQEPRGYSATLTPAVSIPVSGKFFIGAEIGVGPSGTVRMSNDRTGAGTKGPVYVGTNNTWSLFNSSVAIGYRLYCGSNSGTATNYGTGKVGSNKLTSRLFGIGFPNLGNPLTFQVVDAPASSVAILAIGRRIVVPAPPVGTVYVLPIFLTLNLPTSALGFASFDIKIPNSAQMTGIKFATQVWSLDSAATGGLTHTDGFEVTIGN